MTAIDQYLKWLKSQFVESKVDSWTEIITPYLDRNNDHLQLYIRETQNKIIITDDGQTFSNLEMTGFAKTEKRMELLATIFRGFHVEWTEDAKIEITCEKEKFPENFHSSIQTILSVDSMGYLSRENVKSMFMEDVAAHLRENEVTYHANYEVKGRSGLNVTFPFYVPAHKSFQESHIQLINQPKFNSKSFLFEWSDTEELRKRSKAIALINDSYIQPSKKMMSALKEYDVTPILWSEKDQLIDELAS